MAVTTSTHKPPIPIPSPSPANQHPPMSISVSIPISNHAAATTRHPAQPQAQPSPPDTRAQPSLSRSPQSNPSHPSPARPDDPTQPSSVCARIRCVPTYPLSKQGKAKQAPAAQASSPRRSNLALASFSSPSAYTYVVVVCTGCVCARLCSSLASVGLGVREGVRARDLEVNGGGEKGRRDSA